MNTRGPYQGMLQILRFNRRFYAGTLATVALALFAAEFLSDPWRVLLRVATLPALFWTCSSLLVSHYVYDRFPLYNLNWLSKHLLRPPKQWVNIHAGLDETSYQLAALFPSAEGRVVDIYDPLEMTERSIAQARDHQTLGTCASWSALPLPANTFDAVFLMFTAHELRRPAARVLFFRELARVLRHDGEVALIEHARDWPNFLAFGPGFLHFFSPRSWRQTARAAGFEVRTEFRITPFVEVLILRNAQ